MKGRRRSNVMPTASKTEHDFIENPALAEKTTTKEFLLAVINERDARYRETGDDRKELFGKLLEDMCRRIAKLEENEERFASKDQVVLAYSNQKEAMVKADAAN